MQILLTVLLTFEHINALTLQTKWSTLANSDVLTLWWAGVLSRGVRHLSLNNSWGTFEKLILLIWKYYTVNWMTLGFINIIHLLMQILCLWCIEVSGVQNIVFAVRYIRKIYGRGEADYGGENSCFEWWLKRSVANRKCMCTIVSLFSISKTEKMCIFSHE